MAILHRYRGRSNSRRGKPAMSWWQRHLAVGAVVLVGAAGWSVGPRLALADCNVGGPAIDPAGIAAGPDGNVWFTDREGVGSVTPGGCVSQHGVPGGLWPVAAVQIPPPQITQGSDRNLWFTDVTHNAVWRITTRGVLTKFAVAGSPFGISAGSDGALWFTLPVSNLVGRITTGGVASYFPISGIGPGRIITGPDGALWFAEGSAGARSPGVGRITTKGIYTDHPISGAVSVTDVASGPDGNVWFAYRHLLGCSPHYCDSNEAVGKMTTSGLLVGSVISGNQADGAQRLARGVDGRVWITQENTRAVIAMTTGFVATSYAVSAEGVQQPIAAGPGPAMWVGLEPHHVAAITPGGSVTQFLLPAPPPTITMVSANGGLTSGGQTVDVYGESLDGATAVTFGGVPAQSFSIRDDGDIVAVTPVHAAGVVDVRVTTSWGTSATGSADRFRYVVQPTVTSVTPKSGTEGTTVVIKGTGFSGASGVEFKDPSGPSEGSTAVRVLSDSEIVASAPQCPLFSVAPPPTDTVDVIVQLPFFVDSAVSAADHFTYTPCG
jgi:streptogramin lyase